MGFEFKIIAKLTYRQTAEIQNALFGNSLFNKLELLDGKQFWNFRKPINNGKLPNLTIAFEEDGIYVCQYESSNLWSNLDKLKEYFENHKITYEIVDYQE